MSGLGSPEFDSILSATDLVLPKNSQSGVGSQRSNLSCWPSSSVSTQHTPQHTQLFINMSGPLILGLWSIVLQPGQTFPQKTTPAIQITNISYGAEVKGDARSVVSIKYPEFEQDSDDEDEEDDDEEEEDDDDIKLPKIITKEAVLAVLKPNQTEQVSINVSLVEDVEIVEFSVTGDNAVHLVGHYTRQEDFDQDPYSDSDDDEEIDSDFDEEDDEDEDMSAEDDDDSARFAEIQELVKEATKKPTKREASDEAADEADESASLSKNQKKKLAKKLKTETGAAAPAPAAAAAKPAAAAASPAAKPAAAAKSASRTLPGGLVITDSKVGTGAVAKNGKKVGMRYIGKLDNGKVFDSNTKGAPLVFNLGRGEVIKGWDQGVLGMAVGGERKLVIPAALAYGKKGAPPQIPGGATLSFDVKLVSLK